VNFSFVQNGCSTVHPSDTCIGNNNNNIDRIRYRPLRLQTPAYCTSNHVSEIHDFIIDKGESLKTHFCNSSDSAKDNRLFRGIRDPATHSPDSQYRM
jgi:hypothetical protein